MATGYLLQENGDQILQETGDQIIVSFSPSAVASRHRLRLLYGNDKRNPLRYVDISQNDPEGNIFLKLEGFNPAPGEIKVDYRESFYLHGGQRWHSRVSNPKLKIIYNLRGDTAADLENVQATINRFAWEVGLFNEHRQGEKCWLEYHWADGLSDFDALIFGQRQRYYEILYAWPGYPDNLHTGSLVGGNIDGAILTLECSPFIEGLEQIAGDCSGLPDTGSDVDLTYTLTTELDAVSFTISGWIEHQAANYVFFEYYLSATEYLRVWYDNSNTTIKIAKTSGGVTTTTTSSAVNLAGPTQLIFSNQRYGNAVAYINGAAVATTTYSPTGPAGQLRLGGSVQDTSQTSYTNDLDGWKIWKGAFDSDQASQLYNNELPIKRRGGWIGRPLYHKTLDGAGSYNAVDGVVSSTAKDNWGVVSGVAGDAPAHLKWAIDPPTSSPSRVYWLGLKSLDAAFTPINVVFLDFDATADSGNSSGDGYTSSGAGTGNFTFGRSVTTLPTTPLRGRFQVLVRTRVTTNSVTFQPYYQLGSSTANTMDAVTVGTSASFVLRDLGDIYIDWPQDTQPPTITLGAVVGRGSTATVDVDFIAFLPWPFCRVEAEQASLTVASGDTLIIEGRNAYILDASDNDSQLQRFEFEGDEVGAIPNKYNYIFLLQGEESQQYTVSRTATMKAYVTPRWLMGGGPAG